MQNWSIKTDTWTPGIPSSQLSPDRMFESITGSYLALFFGIHEIRMAVAMGELAILKGPPEKPQVLLLSGIVAYPGAQWLEAVSQPIFALTNCAI